MKRTQEQMQQAINGWQQSGLSRKAFCEQHNIAYQTFNYWCKRVGAERTSGFTEINAEGLRSSGYEVIFASGTRMLFQGEPTASWLRELLR